MYNRISKSVNPNVWNFALLWSPLAIPFFQPFVTGSNKSGWDHVVDKSAWPTVLLLCSSLWPLLGSVMYWVRWKAVMVYGMRLSFYSLISFMLLKSVCVFRKNKLPCLLCFWGYFITFINGIKYLQNKFLETNRCLILKMDSSYFNACTMHLLLFSFQPTNAQTYITYNKISL